MVIDTTQLWQLHSSGYLALILSTDDAVIRHLQRVLDRTPNQAADEIYPRLPRAVMAGGDSADGRLACVRWYLGMLLMGFFDTYAGLFAEAKRLEGATFDEC